MELSRATIEAAERFRQARDALIALPGDITEEFTAAERQMRNTAIVAATELLNEIDIAARRNS